MGDEIEQLRHNLKVSFSRMKQDIQSNQDKIDQLLEINQKLTEYIQRLESKLGNINQSTPLKSELMRSFKRNKKQIIKQRILDLVQERQIPVPELKELIVDDKQYCSKATFYRYIDELEKRGSIDYLEINGTKLVVIVRKEYNK